MLSPVMSQQAAGSWLLTRLATTLNNMLKSTLSVCNSDNHDHKHLCGLLFSPPKTVTARGYGYGGPSLYGHGVFDPLTLLAGLAFLAFLLQTLHALLYRSPGVTTRMSSETIPELTETVVAAFDKYDILNQQRSINQQTSTWSSLARVMKAAVHWYWQPTRDQSCSPDLGCNAVQ